MAGIKNNGNKTTCWWGYREIGTLAHRAGAQSAAAMENSMEGPQKIKNIANIQSSPFIFVYLPKVNKNTFENIYVPQYSLGYIFMYPNIPNSHILAIVNSTENKWVVAGGEGCTIGERN